MFTRQRYVAGDLTGQSRLERRERFYLFGHLARSLSPTRTSPSSLSLSFASSLLPRSGKDNSLFLSPSLLFRLPFRFSPFMRLTTSKAIRSVRVNILFEILYSYFCEEID